MAVTEYIVPESVLTELADNLRKNAGWNSSQKLSWPNGFISAINAAQGQGTNEFNFSAFVNRTIDEAIIADAINIGNYAFAECYNLSTASFPMATTIGDYAFAECLNLSTINFPSATNIGNYAFADCYNLSVANFPSVTYIGSYAFQYCSRLTTTSFPLVTSIGNSAFENCSSLLVASFPSATMIEDNAFYYCNNLLSLYLLGSSIAQLLNANAFESTPISIPAGGVFGSIFVRQSLLTDWKAATNWTIYSSRFVGLTDAQIAEL